MPESREVLIARRMPDTPRRSALVCGVAIVLLDGDPERRRISRVAMLPIRIAAVSRLARSEPVPVRREPRAPVEQVAPPFEREPRVVSSRAPDADGVARPMTRLPAHDRRPIRELSASSALPLIDESAVIRDAGASSTTLRGSGRRDRARRSGLRRSASGSAPHSRKSENEHDHHN